MGKDSELYEKISKISGKKCSLAEIGAVVKELEGIGDPKKALELVKNLYSDNQFSDVECKNEGIPPAERENIKNRCRYIRECMVEAVQGYIHVDEDKDVKKEADLFLFDCLKDPDHEIYRSVLRIAPSLVDEDKLIESYFKFRESEKQDNPQIKEANTAKRRGLIFALGEKAQLLASKKTIDEERIGRILNFIDKTLYEDKDPDVNVCEAAIEVFGLPKNIPYVKEEHVRTLEGIVAGQELDPRLKANKVLKEIKYYQSTRSSE